MEPKVWIRAGLAWSHKEINYKFKQLMMKQNKHVYVSNEKYRNIGFFVELRSTNSMETLL